jgi:hypothetical protein
VLYKEAALSAHVVLLVANISPSMNPRSNSCIVELSDGSYSLCAFVNGDKPVDGSDERWDCDRILLKMIHEGKLRAGDKFHFYGLWLMHRTMPGFDKLKPLDTEHYFLQNAHSVHL